MTMHKTSFAVVHRNYPIVIYGKNRMHKSSLMLLFFSDFSLRETLSVNTVAGSLRKNMNLHGTLKQMEFSMMHTKCHDVMTS